MCHGAIDPKFLMRDAEDRFRAAAFDPVDATSPDDELPTGLAGRLRGLLARLRDGILRGATSAL